MCSPDIAARVRETIRARGGTVDRRRLLAGGTAVIAAGTMLPMLAGAQEATPVVAQQPAATPQPSAIYSSSVPISRIYDLTYTLTPDFPLFPGYEPMEIEEVASIDKDGFRANRVTFTEHSGTHVDAPSHFIPDGFTAAQIDPAAFFAPLCVIDISAKAADDPDAVVTDGDIAAWEAINGTIPDRAFVAMYSGWGARVNDPESFVNADDEGTPHFPGWSGQAVALLTGERSVVGIGVDTLSLDAGNATEYLAHVNALEFGLYGIENLANLETLPPVGTTIVVGGPKHIDATGGPARVFAIEFR